MSGARFVLHPAAELVKSEAIKPDALGRLSANLKAANDRIAKVYEGCTNLSQADIGKMLTAEYFSRNVGDAEAVKIGLANKILSVEYPGAASAYIFDGAGPGASKREKGDAS
jgi:ATP-dependent protease ClpP protease subunit